jgi:hypothetical protein
MGKLVEGERARDGHGRRQEHHHVLRLQHGDDEQPEGAGSGDQPLEGGREGGVH